MSYAIVRGNALALPLADASVDLVVTSPPYFGLRSYQDGGEHYARQIGAEATPADFVDALIAATREMMRVVKPSGSIFVNLGDSYAKSGPCAKGLRLVPQRYAVACADSGWIVRQEIVWQKGNPMPDPGAKDRAARHHEHWWHMVKSPDYYSNLDAIRISYTSAPFAGQKTHHAKESNVTANPILGATNAFTHNRKGKVPGDVWVISSEPLKVPESLGVRHFAPFPMEWPRRFIKGWCPPGGTVFDPFGGTGTTALVADVLGRHGVSMDLSADYCRLAAWRCTDPGQRASAMQVERPAAAPEGVDDLLALLDVTA